LAIFFKIELKYIYVVNLFKSIYFINIYSLMQSLNNSYFFKLKI